MSEGYFPDGDPSDEILDYHNSLNDRLQFIATAHANVKADDVHGHYEIICAFLELMPFATSLIIAKGELLEVMAIGDDDVKLNEAKECYESVLRLEPDNARAKLDLGLYYLNIEQDPQKALTLLRQAKSSFFECYTESCDAIDLCNSIN